MFSEKLFHSNNFYFIPLIYGNTLRKYKRTLWPKYNLQSLDTRVSFTSRNSFIIFKVYTAFSISPHATFQEGGGAMKVWGDVTFNVTQTLCKATVINQHYAIYKL